MNGFRAILAGMALALAATTAFADDYDDTIAKFKEAGQSAGFFKSAYGYAVFPTIGKAGLVVGGARGTGHVYQGGTYVGDSTLTKVSIGFQAGGQAYSQIIFFEDKKAFDAFTSEDFEFNASANAVLIRSGASAEAGTTGTATSANTNKESTNAGKYQNGMVVFSIVKGGAMYEASLGGQKYSYKPKK